MARGSWSRESRHPFLLLESSCTEVVNMYFAAQQASDRSWVIRVMDSMGLDSAVDAALAAWYPATAPTADDRCVDA
jgi:hypothetical protein